MKSVRKPMFMGIAVILMLAAVGFVRAPEAPTKMNNAFSLQAPPFVSIAWADEESITSVIEDEAGISAYFQATTPINMTSVRDAFRTIEGETTDYIVGSVEVLDYPESEDVHVYVDTDGWILAYYLAADPVGKIYDWRAYHTSGRTDLSTKLENTLIKVAGYAVVAYPGCTYYDFRYPDATHLMLIAEWTASTSDPFEVNLPGTFVFDERSWAFGTTDRGGYQLNEVDIIRSDCNAFCTSQGVLEPALLLPEQFHMINIWAESGDYGYGGLALIYRVP